MSGTAAATQASPAQQQANMVAQNMAVRRAVISQAIDMWQTIYSNTLTSGAGSVINIPLRNVGLVKRLLVRVRCTVAAASSGNLTLTNFGIGNFFSNVTLTDLSNQQRINTSGWHLAMVQTAKRRRPFMGANNVDVFASTTNGNWTLGHQYNPFGFGNNWNGSGYAGNAIGVLGTAPLGLNSATPTITASSTDTGEVDLFLEIPVSYSDHDLRGAIYANINNATFNLQLTVNPNLIVTSAADPTLAMYQGGSSVAGASAPTFDIEVIQNYLDQLPRDKNNVVQLPMLDLSTAYLFQNTAVSGVVQSQDNPIPYANFREFMSTTVIYDNAGVQNGGTDINYFALQSANFTNIWKIAPKTAAGWARLILGCDPPNSMYYFDHRHRPINTRTYGNMELVVNPSSVGGSTAAFLVGWESLAIINLVTGAGSLFGT